MQLIFIYGPPAVGKLTVARELGRLTGLPVFDNHLSIDCVRPVFDYGSPQLNLLVGKIRHLVIGEAARQDVSLIFTFVYAHPDDGSYVDRICELVESHGGSVEFVQLACAAPEQEGRVIADHRVGRKIDNVEMLRGLMAADLSQAIPGRGGLRIDNTQLAAADAALHIAAKLNLAVVS